MAYQGTRKSMAKKPKTTQQQTNVILTPSMPEVDINQAVAAAVQAAIPVIVQQLQHSAVSASSAHQSEHGQSPHDIQPAQASTSQGYDINTTL